MEKRVANLLSLPLTKAGFGFQEVWGGLQQHNVTCCLHCQSDSGTCISPHQGLHALAAAVLQGLAVVWVTQGSTAGGVVTNTSLRGGQCCGQAPRPPFAVAEMRVSSCSYSGENHSKNPLGTWASLTLTKRFSYLSL